MLMRIEMQLRQQAPFNHLQDSDAERIPQLSEDDAQTLNSRLGEISSILARMIRTTSSVGQRSWRRRTPHRGGELSAFQRLRRATLPGQTRPAAAGRYSTLSDRGQWREVDPGTNGEDSSTTDDDDNNDDVLLSAGSLDRDVDDFIWHELHERHTQSPPDGMSTISSVADFQPLQTLSAVSSAASSRPVSGISNISYTPSVSFSVYDDAQISEPLGLHGADSWVAGPCSHYIGDLPDDDDDDDDPIQCHLAGFEDYSGDEMNCGPSVSGDDNLERRLLQIDISSPLSDSNCAVYNPHSTESVNMSQTCGTVVMAPPTVCHMHQPVVRPAHAFPALQTPLPAVGMEATLHHPVMDSPVLSLLPGVRRPPRLNYAARLRMQTSETVRLPSEVTVRPWPLPDAAAGINRLASATTSGSANRRVGPRGCSSARQLPTLPVRQSSTTPQSGASHRVRSTRVLRSLGGDRTRAPRP